MRSELERDLTGDILKVRSALKVEPMTGYIQIEENIWLQATIRTVLRCEGTALGVQSDFHGNLRNKSGH